MTSEEVYTLDDALRFDGERCTETLKEAWEHVKEVHPDEPASLRVIKLNTALRKTYRENPEYLFPLMNAVIGKFLVPELTPEEQYSVRMYNLRRKDNE